MIHERYHIDVLRHILPVFGQWHPYPVITERAKWQSLASELQQNLVSQGESFLNFTWPTMPASLFLEYKRNGNRSRYENLRYTRRNALRDLLLAECVENNGRFLDQIVNGIWVICEETYWGVPAHVNMQSAGIDLPDAAEPTVDLFAAETVALLAWAYYLLDEKLDKVSSLVRPRIMLEAQRRILEPCLSRDDFWWMGFDPGRHGVNNWNPWVNSNWLTAVLLLEKDADRRYSAVDKILRSLDIFIGIYGDAGGCDEGPGYWGRAAASLFECLDQLYSASKGQINLFKESKIKNMGRFIYRTHIANRYYVNYADASAINHPSAPLVFRYGRAIQDQHMMEFGVWLSQMDNFNQKARDSLSRELPRLFDVGDLAKIPAGQPLPRDTYFDGIQVMVARDTDKRSDGFFVSVKGGHNAESHNHNDVGTCIVFIDGLPVIIDAGVETYTKKTFSPQRYEIWTMQSAYHNLLPTLDGVQQKNGREFEAKDVGYRADEKQAQFTLDMAKTYPASAGLQSMQRTLTLQRGSYVEISDIVIFNKVVKKITLSILTPSIVQIKPNHQGKLDLTSTLFSDNQLSGNAVLYFDQGKFSVYTEQIPIADTRMFRVWGNHLNRIVFTHKSPVLRDVWNWKIKKD